MDNPFQIIDQRLENLESLLLDIKHNSIPQLINSKGEPVPNVVDLNGLIKARPFIGSRSTIYKKISAGEIPHSKNGNRLIFDLKLIDEWLLSNKMNTTTEIEEDVYDYLKRRTRRRSKKA